MKSVRQVLKDKGYSVETITPQASVYEALQKMANRELGALIVFDGGVICGLFSERDYARKVVLQGRFSKDTRVEEIMTRRVITVEPQQTVEACMVLMTDKHIRHLPVVEEGRLVGIVNLRDLLDLIMPAFVNLIDDFDYVGDFGVLEGKQPPNDLLNQPVTAVMQKSVFVPADSGLLRAFAYLHKYELLDLPVIDEQERLIGLVSRVDVGRALLAGWHLNL